nr:hypothetical protein [Nocardia wallacei]
MPALVSAAPVGVLDPIERRVLWLWLSVAMIDHANRVRANPSGLKVGGHQASSASMVSIMTALWFEQLTTADRVSVKPHAAPVLHAINYLLGRLDEPALTTLRARLDAMSNPEYQRLLRLPAAGLRERLPWPGAGAAAIGALLDGVGDEALLAALRNPGGHDRRALRESFAAIDDSRPIVIFACTVKGHGLPTEGHPHNHSSLLSTEQLESVTAGLEPISQTGGAGFDPASDEGVLCARTAQAIAAATRLHELGIETEIVCVTSPGLLFAAVQARRGRRHGQHWILDTLFGGTAGRPMVTVLDGHPHTLAFLATVHGVPAIHLGVTEFGQSGDLAAVYRYHGIDTDSIVRAALDLVPAP